MIYWNEVILLWLLGISEMHHSPSPTSLPPLTPNLSLSPHPTSLSPNPSFSPLIALLTSSLSGYTQVVPYSHPPPAAFTFCWDYGPQNKRFLSLFYEELMMIIEIIGDLHINKSPRENNDRLVMQRSLGQSFLTITQCVILPLLILIAFRTFHWFGSHYLLGFVAPKNLIVAWEIHIVVLTMPIFNWKKKKIKRISSKNTA